jgi:hypothetical protein
MIFFLEVTIVMCPLPCLFRMAKAVSFTIELVNSVTSYYVNSINFETWAFASFCFLNRLVPCSDGWRGTWWQMIHIFPRLPVSSNPRCKFNPHEDTCLELFRAIGLFHPTFIEPNQPLTMMCNVRAPKSQMTLTHSSLNEIITSSNKVFKDFESEMAVGSRKLGHPTWQAARSNVTIKQTAGS